VNQHRTRILRYFAVSDCSHRIANWRRGVISILRLPRKSHNRRYGKITPFGRSAGRVFYSAGARRRLCAGVRFRSAGWLLDHAITSATGARQCQKSLSEKLHLGRSKHHRSSGIRLRSRTILPLKRARYFSGDISRNSVCTYIKKRYKVAIARIMNKNPVCSTDISQLNHDDKFQIFINSYCITQSGCRSHLRELTIENRNASPIHKVNTPK
jgi:hypothetical protein